MKNLRKAGILLSLLLVIALVAGCGLFGPKKGTVSGSVLDKYELTPITGALVQIGEASKTTGTDGTFSIADVPQGSATVKVTKEGYKVANQTITVEENSTITIYLEKDIDPAHNIVSNFTSTTLNIENMYTNESSMLQQGFEETLNPWFQEIAPNLIDLEHGLYLSGVLTEEPGTYEYIENEWGYGEYILVEAWDTTGTELEWRVTDSTTGITVIITTPNLGTAITEDVEGNTFVDLTGSTFIYTITSETNPTALYEATLNISAENVQTLTIITDTGRIEIKMPAGPTAELDALVDADVTADGQVVKIDGTIDFATAVNELKLQLNGTITTSIAAFTGSFTFALESGLTVNMNSIPPVTFSGNGTFTTALFELGGDFSVHLVTDLDNDPLPTAASFNCFYKSEAIDYTGTITFEFANFDTFIEDGKVEYVFGFDGELSYSDGSEYSMNLTVTTDVMDTVEIEFDMARNNFTLTGEFSDTNTVDGRNTIIDVTDDQGTTLFVNVSDTTPDGSEVGWIKGADGTKHATIKVTGVMNVPTFVVEYTDGEQFEFIPFSL